MPYGYDVTITPPDDVLAAIQDQLQQAPTLMATVYKRNFQSRLQTRWRNALRVEPPDASGYYPLVWTSIKQRKAFFATQGFGRGIPTPRTHALSQAWDVDIASAEDGGEITVTNDAPEAVYVVGESRQPMFDGSIGMIPWIDPDLVNVQFLEEAEDVLIESWFTVSSPTAGVS